MIRRMKVCLNGSRGRDEHPAVPVTGVEVAEAAAASVAAGAEAVHVHPRGPDGRQSLRLDDIAAAVTATRRRCPGVPIGVSTGLWMTGGDVGTRRSLVRSWGDGPDAGRPDFASVNVSEPGFAELCDELRRLGIGVEAGVWSVADADALADGLGGELVRILVEVFTDGAVEMADRILARLDRTGLAAPRLLHGEGPACWPLVAHAGRLRLPTRVGLEDTMVGPDGRPARDNAELVERALAVWAQAGQSV